MADVPFAIQFTGRSAPEFGETSGPSPIPTALIDWAPAFILVTAVPAAAARGPIVTSAVPRNE
jgi:hypothetical protein